MRKQNTQSGFSIIIAVIVTGVLLAIAFSVSNLATKQSVFSVTNRESQYASFAADAGIECALLWDAKTDAFATSSSHTTSSINCNNNTSISSGSAITGSTTAISRIGGGGDANQMSLFGFSLDSAANPSNQCAIVAVYKYYEGTSLTTHIYSYGYNNCNTSDPRRVERGIEVQY